MWIFLADPAAFLSIVRKPGDDHLTVRARVRADLVRFGEVCALSPIRSTPTNDYPFRATTTPAAFADALATAALRVTYGNFKSQVGLTLGHRRASIYERVWADLRELQHDPDPSELAMVPDAAARPHQSRRRRRRRP